MPPQFFDKAETFLESQTRQIRSQYLTVKATLNLCQIAHQQGFYIDWYECGILHEKNGVKSYEGRETWGKNYSQISNSKLANISNQEALTCIKQDIIEGHTAFCVAVKRYES